MIYMKEKLERLPFYNSLVVPYHVMTAFVAGAKAGWPGRKLKVIGVTGTNGKTTTTFMIWKMLNATGHKAGLMTTVAWGGVTGRATPSADTLPPRHAKKTPKSDTPASSHDNPATRLNKQIEHMTTVDAATLNRRIAAIAEAGAEYLVLEVTSHALAQHRILGVPIEVAVFTNLTHEHLDYHRTLVRYRKAKCKLFSKARYGVANADDPACEYFINEVPEGVTYGIQHGEVRARGVTLGAGGVGYSIGDDMQVQIQIPGEFNVYNSLAAVCVGRRLGLTDDEITRGLAELDEVEGRMNRIDEGQNYQVIVDFAHTPDAFQKVYDAVAPEYGGGRAEREKCGDNKKKRGGAKGQAQKKESGAVPGRIISLFGGAGRRDESTRFSRGEIGGRYSDIVIVTEDDSRDEDPAAIAEEFVRGAKKSGCRDVRTELDRKKAIELAVGLARKGDLVLILGKGHEKTILRADGAHPFEDLKVTREAIRMVG